MPTTGESVDQAWWRVLVFKAQKDALFARLDALVDAVETAKDGEEQKTALNAFSRQKVGIARRLSELVDSMQVGQETTKPLEEAGVAQCRQSRFVLLAGAALQAAATRRDAPGGHASPLKSNEATFSDTLLGPREVAKGQSIRFSILVLHGPL